MGGIPVVVVASGGLPVANTTRGAAATPNSVGGMPITIVTDGTGLPLSLVNDDLSAWSAGGGTNKLDFSDAANSQYIPVLL